MFKSNKAEPKNKTLTMSNGSQSINSLVQGTILEGTIRTDSDIRIDGKLIGKLICKGKVIVGPTGEIQGDIDCLNALFEGRFSGKVKVHEVLQVKESANVQGEVETKKLIVQSGSIFNVTCRMGGQTLSKPSNGSAESRGVDKISKVARPA